MFTYRSYKGCKCRRFDFLGEPVALKYKGSTTVQSSCGSFCSLLIVSLIVLYLGNAVTIVARETPGIMSQTTRLRSNMTNDAGLKDDLFEVQMPAFKPFESGFGFAIGFQSLKSYGLDPDPDEKLRDGVGTFKLEYVTTNSLGVQNATKIDLVPCHLNPLLGDAGVEINVKSYMCSNVSSVELYGGRGAFSFNSSHL